MKIAIFLAALISAAAALPLAAVEDHQQHQTSNHMALSLDHGRKWATDEPLRAGMTQIRSAMADNLEKIHKGELTTNQYRDLGTAIQHRISTIITQCKLDPRADAMLHIIIADLITGADAMTGKGDMAPATGAHKVVEAMNAYGEYFNHPGWRGLP